MDHFFDKIYTEYKHQVFFFVKKYIQGQEDIEDVVQEIFVHLWKHRSALSSNRDAIIFKTAKQEIAQFYRKKKIAFSDFEESLVTDVVKDPLEEEEELAQNTRKIEMLLHQLPEKSKGFFLKHTIDGLSYSKIAEEHNISKNAVAKHVNKVLGFLKTNLGSFLFF